MSLAELDENDEQPTNAPSEGAALAGFQQELRSYYQSIRGFSQCDISEILLTLAGCNARAAEIRDGLVANESRRAAHFRTRQLEPFMECLEFQFKVFSRLQAVRQMEADFTRGGYT